MTENKNSDAAKAEFDTWDDMAVFDMQYFLSVAFSHKEWPDTSANDLNQQTFLYKKKHTNIFMLLLTNINQQ